MGMAGSTDADRRSLGPRPRLRNPMGGDYVSAMTTLRTVLFDLDGTLIDSVRLILDSYHHTLAAHGLPPRTDEDWLRGVGTPLTGQLAEWRDEPEPLEALIATYRKYNLEHHDRMVTVYPGVVDAVQALKAAGVATGLVTSKNRSGAVRGLSLAKLESLMDVLVCADEVTNPKPHPEPVETAVRLLGADPRNDACTWGTASTTCCRAGRRGYARRPRSGDRSGGPTWRALRPITGWIRRRT